MSEKEENSSVQEGEIVDEIIYTMSDKDANEFEQTLFSNNASLHILENGYNFSIGFKRFQMKLYQEARTSSLIVNANIHEILQVDFVCIIH